MSAGQPPRPPPPRLPPRETLRYPRDPRRDSPSPEAPRDWREMAIALGTANVALATSLPALTKAVADLTTKVDAHLILHHPVRGEAISSQDLTEALAKERATESIRIKATLVRWTGAFVWDAIRRSWQIALGLAITAALGIGSGYVLRDCQAHVPVPAAHP